MSFGNQTGSTFNKEDDFIKENSRSSNRRITLSGTGFEKADYEKALKERQKQSNFHYKGEQVSSFVNINHFKMYGIGISLFFNFMWHISMLFLVFSFLSIIPMCYNYLNGTSFKNTVNTLQLTVTKLSIGSYYYKGSTDATAIATSIGNKYVNVFTDFACIIIFVVFFFYWERKSKKIMQQIKKQIVMPSQNTIQIVQFPECADETVIESFLSKFGKVQEVAAVKNYQQKIYLSKKIYQIQLQIKQIQIELAEQADPKKQEKIKDLQSKIQKLNIELSKEEQTRKNQYIKFYVMFETEQDKKQIIKKFQPYQKFFSCCTTIPDELMINSEKIVIEECLTEPGGIIWENMHITWATRWMRLLFQLILILAIIVGGFLFISFLNVIIPEDNSEGVDTSHVNSTSILSQTDPIIRRVWCINNIVTYYSDADVGTVCMQYWYSYAMGLLITIGTSLAIVVFKLLVKIIVVGLAKFQRYKTHTEQSVTMMTNLMITYISTTVLITFLMQANIFGISFKSVMVYVIADQSILNNLVALRQYQDLTHIWYLDIGYQIWFNSLILAFIPHFILPIAGFFLEKLSECFASGQKLQKNMVSKLKKPEFQIEDHYANILMLMVIGMFFGGSMPAIIPITFIGLITRYLVFKIVFIRFSRVPKTYNQALNNRTMNIMKITIIAKCFFSIWAYGVNDIFVDELSIFTSFTSSTVIIGQIVMLIERIFITWYLGALTLLIILALILRDTLVECILTHCKKNEQEQQESLQKLNKKKNRVSIMATVINAQQQAIENEKTPNSEDQFPILSQRALTKSYRIENNPDYSEIISIMKLNEHRNQNSSNEEKL